MSQSKPLAKQKYTITDKTSTCKLHESQIMSYCIKPNKYHFPSIIYQNVLKYYTAQWWDKRSFKSNSTVHPHQLFRPCISILGCFVKQSRMMIGTDTDRIGNNKIGFSYFKILFFIFIND